MTTTLIREQGLVDLLIPGERRRAARVSAIGHGHVLLTLFGLPIEATLTGAPTDARIELVGDDGVSRLEGRIAHGGDPRALTFEPFDPAALPQRRSADRVELDRELLVERRTGASATARVVDISEGGVRFRSAAAFRLGHAVDLAFTSDDPDVDPLLGAGQIVRVQGDGEYAVEFGPWPEGELRRLRILLETGRVQP